MFDLFYYTDMVTQVDFTHPHNKDITTNDSCQLFY